MVPFGFWQYRAIDSWLEWLVRIPYSKTWNWCFETLENFENIFYSIHFEITKILNDFKIHLNWFLQYLSIRSIIIHLQCFTYMFIHFFENHHLQLLVRWHIIFVLTSWILLRPLSLLITQFIFHLIWSLRNWKKNGPNVELRYI